MEGGRGAIPIWRAGGGGMSKSGNDAPGERCICAGASAFVRQKSPPMTDADTPLQVLKDRVLAFAAERDWQQFHSPKNLAMALAAEAAELTEHFLWTETAASHARAADPARRAQIAEELADVLIYTLEFANVTGLDLTAAALAKLARNAEKYPVEKARGRSDKYTEL